MVQLAVGLEYPEVVAALLRRGLSPNTNTGERGSALQIALGLKNATIAAEIAKMLLEHGADTKAAEKGCVDHPLHLAVRRRSVAMTKLLLDYGADVHAESSEWDETTMIAFHAAVAARPMSFGRELLIASASASAKYGYDGPVPLPITPLRMAVWLVNIDIMRLLLESGARAEPLLLHLLSLAPRHVRLEKRTQIGEARNLLFEYEAWDGREISMRKFRRETLRPPEHYRLRLWQPEGA
jgi:ankyrin repeat protein